MASAEVPVTPYLSDPDFTLWNGDVRDVLRELPAESVDCALTSPPFFGLRDYGTGQWEGGDPSCDHVAGSDHRDLGFNERWGSTTALVARRLGRHAVGVELSAEYCAMAARRLSQLSLLAEGAA